MNHKAKEHGIKQREKVAALFKKHLGNVSAIAREMRIERSTVRKHLAKLGLNAKPLFGGSVRAQLEKLGLPPKGRIRRFLLTSAQNNTPVNGPMWASLLALAEHYDAGVMVGTFTYNTNSYGKLAVKRGTEKDKIEELAYAPELEGYIVDQNIEIANGLVWCGRMNILPTAVNPLAGLETYTHRKSAIFPHAKLAMRTIPTMLSEWAKINYTTGCVTQMNYIQKKEGIKAETHHSYSALLVEVNDAGNWWVRQVHASSKDWSMQDLDVVAKPDGTVTTGNRVEAITWGDLHAAKADVAVTKANMEMLNFLNPRHQFLHDVLEGAKINRHTMEDPHHGFKTWLRGLHRVEEDFKITAEIMSMYHRKGIKTVVVDSNHDDAWVKNWLSKYNYKFDHANAEFFLAAQGFMYSQLRAGKEPRDVNMLEWSIARVKPDFSELGFKFLVSDESYLICGSKIECGMHGHLGPNGQRGTPSNLSEVGRRANTAHTHQAGIYNGLYVAGTSTELRWDYNKGPSGWNHSHVLTYPNGARAIVTCYLGMWRAE